jgi:uncharacterized protein with GYD domain
MPKYLMQASFTRDGIKSLAQAGASKRRQAVVKFFGEAGGKLEALYFAFGDTDVFAIADFPDNVSAAALSLAANAAGAVQVKATVLISPEEMDQALCYMRKHFLPRSVTSSRERTGFSIGLKFGASTKSKKIPLRWAIKEMTAI